MNEEASLLRHTVFCLLPFTDVTDTSLQLVMVFRPTTVCPLWFAAVISSPCTYIPLLRLFIVEERCLKVALEVCQMSAC